MHITEVFIKKCGPINKLNWNIPENNKLIILCGMPGIGKTFFLRALTYGLSNLFLGKPSFINYLESEERYVEFVIKPDTYEDELFLKENNRFSYPSYNYKIEKRAEIFGFSVPTSTIFPNSFTSIVKILHKFDIDRHNYEVPQILWFDASPTQTVEIREYLSNIIAFYNSKNKNAEIKVIISKINTFLKNYFNIQIEIKDNQVYFIDKKSRVLETISVSSAEEYTIGMLLTVYACLQKNAILIIDSPETNVPPSILTKLIKIAKTEISNGQIIIATHSPSILAFDIKKEIYLLKSLKNKKQLQSIDTLENLRLFKKLYGKSTFDSIVKYLPNKQSPIILSYLLDCFTNPKAVTRKKGDPQIQQLGLWINGYISGNHDNPFCFVDVGAGYGDLIEAIKINNSSKKIIYFPIESNKKYWSKITKRCIKNNITYNKPQSDIETVQCGSACIIFLINMLHELDLSDRVDILYKSLTKIKRSGLLIIHEVAVLPMGEANFFMWSVEDIIGIFNKTKCKFEYNYSKTFTRPGGWPLETIGIKILDLSPSKEELRESILYNLPVIKKRWEEKVSQQDNVTNLLKDKYTAFLMAQIYNANLWINKYL